MGVSSFDLSPARRGFLFAGSAAVARSCRSLVAAQTARGSAVKRVSRGRWPTRQRRRAFRGEGIGAALDAEEPAEDVAQQNLRRIRDGGFDLGCAPGAIDQRSRASERLLAVGGHDRRLAASTEDGIAEPPPVFVEQL